jgi:hypothetical protein
MLAQLVDKEYAKSPRELCVVVESPFGILVDIEIEYYEA